MVNITLISQILNKTNFTWQTDTFFYKDIEIIAAYINIVILVLSMIGNGLVIFVTGYKMKTTVNSIWFLNLTITDFLFLPILIFFIVFSFNRKLRISDTLPMCGYFIFVLNMFASVFFLTVISLDRCLCSWLVVWAQNKRTLVKARIICVFVWSLAICCSIPFAYFIIKPKDMSLNEDMYLAIYTFMVGFLFPFLIITSSYIAIGVRVKRLTGGNQLRIFRVISVILAFFLCWFPFHLWLFIISVPAPFASFQVYNILFTAQYFVICLVFLNSFLNPILYVFMCDEYKTKLKESLLLVLEGAFSEDHLGLH